MRFIVRGGSSMPLLLKELAEQAARRRTYVMRVVYAVLLGFGFLMTNASRVITDVADFGSVFGRGREMLEVLVMLQFWGIYLFLPAMMSQTIADEKEKETLPLLFLTDMGPWELLLQKYLGRLIPMFCFLLLSVPLMAIAYSFGGIATDYLCFSLWIVVICCLQTGAFALMCSAYCRTPTGAFVASYVGGALFYGLPFLLALASWMVGVEPHWMNAENMFLHIPPFVWKIASHDVFPAVVWKSLPVLISTLLFLLAARFFLPRRVFGTPRNPILATFRVLDRVFTRWNARIGGIVMWKEGGTLPVEEPVAWRELQKRALGRSLYLVRLGLLIEVPTLFIGLGALLADGAVARSEALVWMIFVAWILAALAMTVQGVGVIAAERTRQTLDVLLTTPIAGQDIVRQKMRSLRRFGWLLAVPVLSLVGYRFADIGWRGEEAWSYLLGSLACVAVFLPLLAWGSVWIGLRTSTRSRAVVLSLLVLVIWNGVPVLLLNSGLDAPPFNRLVVFLSPAIVVTEAEIDMWWRCGGGGEEADRGWQALFATALASYAFLTLVARRACLKRADHYLRGEGSAPRRVPARALRLAAVGLAVAGLAEATNLEVKEVVWGFDGQVVPERFNLLSVRVVNPSGKTFDGAVKLVKTIGLDRNVGAPYVQTCYLLPGGERWLQFHPFIASESQWRLEWGNGPTDSEEVRVAPNGPPARVVLEPADALQSARSSIRAFPDRLFPPTVAATDGLDSVLLDYVPRWEAAKREAFLDWIRRGGTLHLFLGQGEAYPAFSGELAVLNGSEPRARIGTGWVVRHALPLREMSGARLEEHGSPEQRLERGSMTVVRQFSNDLLALLSRFSRPRHAWWLINTLTVCYVVLIGPGVFLLARRTRSYRLALLALLGLVAGFGGLFASVGRHGSGEQGAIHSMTCARSLEDGRYVVMQWINVFALRGMDYVLTHDATHNCYAVPQEYESVKGVIQAEGDGRFTVDIPFCSQRSFVHQARMNGPELGLRAASSPSDLSFRGTVFTVGPGFPANPVAAWALHGETVWTLQFRDGRLVPSDAGEAVSNLVSDANAPRHQMQLVGTADPAQTRTAFLTIAPCVLAWALGGTERFQRYVRRKPVPADRVRLFVLAESPESFRLRGTPIGPETGYTLYDTDVLLTPPRKEAHD